LRKTDADDEIELTLSERAEERLEGIIISGFDVFDVNSEVGFGAHCTFVGGGVERFVIFATAVENETDFEFGRESRVAEERKGETKAAERRSWVASASHAKFCNSTWKPGQASEQAEV
jgi:hypothetical protein